jgi:hypothetical protein
MNKRKLTAMMVILYLSVGTVWGQTSLILDILTRNIYITDNNLNPQTASMLFTRYGDIQYYDGRKINWNNDIQGLIFPSGRHTIGRGVGWREDATRFTSGAERGSDGKWTVYKSRIASTTFDFKPGVIYLVGTANGWGVNTILTFTDITNNTDYSQAKAIIQARIPGSSNTAQPTSQPAQPAQTSTRPSTGGGLIGALNRAAQTVMGNLNRDESIAIFGLTTMDRDSAQFVQEELEVILVNNRYDIVDRATLEKIREEQRFQQQSGEVDENTAVNIGRFAGAKIVITGSITSLEGTRYLRLRALNAETGRVIAAASEAM